MNFGGTKINGFVFKLYNYVLGSNDLTIHKKYPRKFHNLPRRYPQFNLWEKLFRQIVRVLFWE